MLTTYEVDKGTATALRVELRDSAGNRPSFSVDDPIRVVIFDGDDGTPPLARPDAVWGDADTGIINIVIRAEDVAAINPGLWLLKATVISLTDGLPRLSTRAWLHIRGGPG